MDTSSVFQSMLDKAIQSEPSAFIGFDRTKNVQDQLQEMIISNSNRNKAEEFGNWVASLHNDWYPFFSITSPQFPNWSMEQLWLAFVMKEKYNKVWNGEDWN